MSSYVVETADLGLTIPSKLALPSFAQHLHVLERSGLVQSRTTGRVLVYRLVPRRLQAAAERVCVVYDPRDGHIVHGQ